MSKPKWRTAIVISDNHVPFHNIDLHKKLIKLIKDICPDDFIILGDFLDMYSLGKYHEGSLHYLSDINLSMEYAEGAKLLDQIDAALPLKTKRHYLWGNHEDRFWRFKKSGDMVKLGEELINPTNALRLNDRGYTVIDDWKNGYIRLGNLTLIHGDSIAIQSTNTMIMKAFDNLMFGHTHRPQVFYRSRFVAHALGCMANIEDEKGMSYMPRIQREHWRNGFGIVRYSDSGQFFVENIVAENGCFVASGKMY